MLFRSDERSTSLGLLVLRLGTGFLLLYGHGWGKFTHFAERSATFADPLHVGSATSLALVVFAEVFCALFVMLGLFTRLSAIPIVIFTLVAVFIQHAADPFGKKELAYFFMVSSVALFLTGGGRYSIDAWLARRAHRAPAARS